MSDPVKGCKHDVNIERFYKRTCGRAAGHGKGGAYCLQHAKQHPAEGEEGVIWWQAIDYLKEIRPVLVVGETPKTVTIKGRGQSAKESQNYRYTPTFGEAKAWLVEQLERDVARLRQSLTTAEMNLLAAKAIHEPADPTPRN